MDEERKMKDLEKIDNPYRPFHPGSGVWFYHESIIQEIDKNIESRSENRIIILRGNPGSGKTSILKHFAESPDIRKKNYIPIYLDSRDYKDHDFDAVLSSVQKDIAVTLDKLGNKIAKPGYSQENRRGDIVTTLKSFLLNIDSIIDADSIMVFIFDDFDYFVETIDNKTISMIIEKFRRIEKDWSDYVLILAAGKRFREITGSTPFNEFFKECREINIEDVLEKEVIKKSIVEPVENKLTYSEEALEEIIRLSGSNLYFQQLLCYYLVNRLNKVKKKHCSIEDVQQTIEKVLGDDRPEFKYAWDNILSMESRLIASALADKRITEESGKFFYLKENTLLHDILGEDVHKKITKLQDYGYLNKIDGMRFSVYPFRIPLYGRWIQKEHPFARTIIGHIEKIADKVDLKKLVDLIDETPEQELLPFHKDTILDMANKWHVLKETILKKGQIVEKKEIEDFFKALSGQLNLSIKAPPQTNENYFVINIKNLGIGILDEAFCFVQDRPELTREDIDNIENIAAVHAEEEAQRKLTLFFYFQPSERVEELVRKEFLNLVPIEENDLKEIILSKRPLDSFKKIILSKLSLNLVSPYKTEGPARSTFYGRMNTIRQIVGTTGSSYAVVGARKIGKSSLLHKLKEKPPQNTIYLFMDLEMEFSNVKNYKTFLRSLRSEIKDISGIKVDSGIFSFGRELSRLPRIIEQLSKDGKRIVFILDEVDYLIQFDRKHGYKLTHIFRTLSQKNLCQFILAGFKLLYQRKRDIEDPLYNFCQEIILEPLDEESALDLITIPMRNLGVQYEDLDDRERILEYTARHPSLLQYFCKNLVERIQKHEKIEARRTIFREDIDALLDSRYERYVIDDVYSFSSELSPLDRLILVLFVEEHPMKRIFSTDETRDRLIRTGIKISRNEVHRSLKILEMRFILQDEEGKDKYRFALPVFPEILKKRIDNDFKKRTIKEIMENVSESL